MSEGGGHRRLTTDAARDLIWLLMVLALIMVGMMAYRASLGQDVEGQAQRDWYYKRVAPNSSKAHTP